jgi:hypothetical protein
MWLATDLDHGDLNVALSNALQAVVADAEKTFPFKDETLSPWWPQ